MRYVLHDTYSEPRLLLQIQTCSAIMAYLELCVTLAYSEPCHIQNRGD